jgi:hypothetical protein
VLCCAVRRNKQSESVDVVASVDKKKEEDPDFMVCKALLNKVVAKKQNNLKRLSWSFSIFQNPRISLKHNGR